MLVFLADQKNDLENLYFFSQKPRTIVRQSGKKRQLLAFLKDFTALFWVEKGKTSGKAS